MQIMDSHIAAGQDLPMKDRQAFYTAVIEYVAYDREPCLKGAAKAVFTAIRPILDNSKERSKAGSKGGSKSPSKRASKQQANAKQTDKQNHENGGSYQDYPSPYSYSSYSPSNPKGDSREANGEQTGFTPPTLDEVRAYFQANCLHGDPDLFFATYDAKGWLTGSGQEITRWTSQALKWSRMQVGRDQQAGAPSTPPPKAENSYTDEDDRKIIEEYRERYGELA